MKKFIIFRTDRLGDFLIITNIIKAIKDKYKNSHITLVGSPYNKKIINNYKIIDKVIIYNKKSSFFEKISIFKEITKTFYYCSLGLDGKSFSNFANFFLNAHIKYGISYLFKFFFFEWSKPNFIYNFLVFNKFETFSSKNSLKKVEHLPTLLIKLANNLELNLTPKNNYFYEIKKDSTKKSNRIFKNKIKSKFVLIHLDEKWKDISNIDLDFSNELIIFQKKIRKKIVLTSNKNNFLYYKKLKKDLKKNRNIIFLENLSLDIFERIINLSTYSISCHSGFLVQISGFNNTNIIDVINKRDYTWYSCWKPYNTRHKFVYKSNMNRKINLNSIFKQIINVSRKLK